MWGTVLVMAVVAAVDPIRIGVVAYMLSRAHPIRLLLPFFVFAFAINVAVGAAVVFVFRDANLGSAGSSSPVLEISVGVLALILAAISATGLLDELLRRFHHSRVPVGGTAESVDPPSLDTLPIVSKLPEGIKAALRGDAAWAAGLLGVINGFPTPYYLAAMAAALTSGTAVGEQMAALVAFNIVGFIAVLVPLISFWIAPQSTRDTVERLYEVMKSRRRLVITVIAGAVGAFFIGLGISHL